MSKRKSRRNKSFQIEAHIVFPFGHAYKFLSAEGNDALLTAFDDKLNIRVTCSQAAPGSFELHLAEETNTRSPDIGRNIALVHAALTTINELVRAGQQKQVNISTLNNWLNNPGKFLGPQGYALTRALKNAPAAKTEPAHTPANDPGKPEAYTDFNEAANPEVKFSNAQKKLLQEITLNVEPRSDNQKDLLEAIETSDITFCLAPAGTGKTFLAVYAALKMLKEGRINRIVVARPAVESGEKLGFLPGDDSKKLAPYMQPVYDHFKKVLKGGDRDSGAALLQKLITHGLIEISPLAFMRGREFENAAVIGDEFQNASRGQLKMFLTRIGQNSRYIVVGDPGQSDLTGGKSSALAAAAAGFGRKKPDGITIIRMTADDVVRHRLIGDITDVMDNLDDFQEPQPPARKPGAPGPS